MEDRYHPEARGPFDVAVIGAGVVGCAMARRFTLEGARVVVIEKAPDPLDGASKGNSAILHTGFDAPTGSLERECMARAYREYLDICERLRLPVLRTGAMVLAWDDAQEAALEGLMEKARANGVTDVERLSAAAVREREPHLSDSVRGGFLVPDEFVIDPWTTPYVFLLQAINRGAVFARSTEVTGGERDGDGWRLSTDRGDIRASTVINCGGLYGDRIDAMLLGEASFEIRPRKGQFVVFDKAARRLLGTIVLPVPTETTKGVVVCPTIFGNVLVGPTAEEQESRDDASVDADTLAALRAEGERILPGLKACPVTATYAGIRPATEEKGYRIAYRADRRYCTVGGIRSTGLTAALGIAAHVFEQHVAAGNGHPPAAPADEPEVLPIAEHGERDWHRPGNGGVVCHCELVTRREIETALSGPLAAASLAGLKRRTRVTMGRCQGFFCSAELARLTEGRFALPMACREDAGE